eukprot:gene12141-14843_t
MIDLSLKSLLVDDDPDILELLEYNLQKEGFQIRTAENGLQGIQVAQDFLPDMILMDIMMPVMDGIEAGRIIKQSKELKNSYLIFLTARTEEYSEVAAFDIGANDYIIKPVKPRALISRIKAVFQRNIAETLEEEKESSWTLPKKEFDLLMFFVSNPNKVYTRDEILSSVWGKGIH